MTAQLEGPQSSLHEPSCERVLSDPTDRVAKARLSQVLIAHAALRIAGGANGILVGLYLATLRIAGSRIDAGTVGALSAVAFVTELLASFPMGIASDAVSPLSRGTQNPEYVLRGCCWRTPPLPTTPVPLVYIGDPYSLRSVGK